LRDWDPQIEGVLLRMDQERGDEGRGDLRRFDGDGFGKGGDGSVGVGGTGRVAGVGERLGRDHQAESLVGLPCGSFLRTGRAHWRILVRR
jgi:hypothetical protein